MIAVSLCATIALEALVALVWCQFKKKPATIILLTGLAGNLLTQAALWAWLQLTVRPYWLVLLTAEVIIWLAEAALLAAVPSNRLRLGEAARLSLWMNLASFGIGLFLPV